MSDAATLKKFSQDLRRLPKVVAHKIAEESAPALTSAAMSTFDASEDAYGNAWLPGDHGQTVTLRKTGNLARTIKYVAIGALLRIALGVSYAKYQIGKRPVFPSQTSTLPDAYTQILERKAVEVVRRELAP